MMECGLSKSTVEKVRDVLAAFPEVERAVLYGSRAKGTYRPGSDIDLALFGNTLSNRQLLDIDDAIDELLLPYHVDLVLYAALNNTALREHIDRVGVSFYEQVGGRGLQEREEAQP